MKKDKFVYLDRDGVINKEIGYLHTIKDFEFIDGVFEACQLIISKGFKIIIITNQSGIGRGYYTLEDFHKLTNWMLQKFSEHSISITDVLFCPHTPEDRCNCRKPKPGMLKLSQEKYNIDLKSSWLIGDTENDIEAAISANIGNTALVRSGHKINEKKTKALVVLNSITDIESIL